MTTEQLQFAISEIIDCACSWAHDESHPEPLTVEWMEAFRLMRNLPNLLGELRQLQAYCHETAELYDAENLLAGIIAHATTTDSQA